MIPFLGEVATQTAKLMAEVAKSTVYVLVRILGLERSPSGGREVTLDERIAHLSSSLQAAATAMVAIEEEVAERAALVEKLRGDAARFERLAALKAQEVEAVAQALRGELKNEGRRSFWLNQVANAFLVLIGIGIGQLIR